MPALTMRTEIRREVLRGLADSRFADFETLRTATPPRFAAAFYLGGYAAENLLKCAICQALNLDELPVIFHVHDLEVLLFFSGRYQEIQSDQGVWASFRRLQASWSEKLRYTDQSTVTVVQCNLMAVWLNDPVVGVMPWLKGRL